MIDETIRLRAALQVALEALEHYEVLCDSEWGEMRSLAEIEQDGDLPECILIVRDALKAYNG